MSASLSLVLLVVGLFLLHYFMNRRFGLPALALAAGFLLSQYTAESMTTILVGQGLPVTQPQVEILLTLLPAFALLFGGPTYGKMHMRLIGASMFTLLALAFVVGPLGRLVEFDPNVYVVYSFIKDYKIPVIIAGLAIALVDVFFGHTPRPKHRKAAH